MTEATVRLERYLGNPSPEREMPPRVGEHGEHLERSVQTIYEWFEWGFRPPPHTNRQREQDVMRRLPERGIVLILGVPGAGKSTLARQWFERLQTDEPTRPALIGECGLLGALEENKNILHAILGRDKNGKARDLLEGSVPERTVLIVDALDELPSRAGWTNRLVSAIREASEHVLVVLTCRTHVWGDALEAVFKREQIRIDQTFTLLGFTPLEQREYLTRWAEHAGKPKQDAQNLAKNLEKHPQLRSLAANALLLELIARVALEDGVMLPTSRAEFYERAIDKLWKHAELKGMIAKRNDLWRLRDRFLRALGLSTKRDDGIEARIGADEINEAMRLAAVPENLQDDLLDYLEKIGLLVKIGDPTSSELRFVHLTFHEFALAQGLMLGVDAKPPATEEITQKLEDLLLKDWTITAFEPTLALAISIAQGKKADLLRPFSSLVNSWRQGQPSALMAALHLYNNAAVESESVTNMLVERIQEISLGALKVAGDSESHPSVLEKLANSDDDVILQGIAWNSNSSPSLLEKLSNLIDIEVLRGIAINPNSMLITLEKLAHHESFKVLEAVAANPIASPNMLEKLANTHIPELLPWLALNPNLPEIVFENLSNSEDAWVRSNLTKNASFPQRLRWKIPEWVHGDENWSRRQNPEYTQSQLVNFYNSNDLKALQWLASNQNSPKSVLEKLSNSNDFIVLWQLAGNLSTPQHILEKLFNSEDGPDVFDRLSRNPNSPPSLLEQLANGDGQIVLYNLAENSSSPQSVLEKLSASEDRHVLQKLVENPSFILEWLSPTPNPTRALYRKPEDASNARGGSVSLEKPRWNPVKTTPDGVISVLFLPSDPADQNHLKLLREMGKIGQQLRGAKHRDRFKLEPQALVTPEEVAQGLRDYQPEIVHFAGHGSSDGRLAWLDETGNSLSVQVEALGNMIGSRREHKVQCVVLNACYTISEAKTLLKQVPYVIATVQAIDDDAAIAFATGLYQALAGGDDLGEAFNAGLALVQAQLSNLQEHEKFVLLERE